MVAETAEKAVIRSRATQSAITLMIAPLAGASTTFKEPKMSFDSSKGGRSGRGSGMRIPSAQAELTVNKRITAARIRVSGFIYGLLLSGLPL